MECPVCLTIPRSLPIPCCPAGHILCRSCRARVLHCPTCRRQLEDNTSSLAATLIERVRHRLSSQQLVGTLSSALSLLQVPVLGVWL